MPRILVVDDNSLVRYALSLLLRKAGYEVLEANEGWEGERIHAENNVDLLVTDLIMEGVEGIETIRNFRKATPDIKIIVVSGGGYLDADDMLNLARRAGADATFTKPIDRDIFLAKVSELLN